MLHFRGYLWLKRYDVGVAEIIEISPFYSFYTPSKAAEIEISESLKKRKRRGEARGK
jgi:hypothetical protein